MNKFQGSGTTPGFAVALNPAALPETPLLIVAEMKKTEQDRAAIVTNADQQAAASSKADVCCLDLTHDYSLAPRLEFCNGGDPGSVLVAQRQVEQQVFGSVNPDFFQLGRELGSDTGQFLQRVLCSFRLF